MEVKEGGDKTDDEDDKVTTVKSRRGRYAALLNRDSSSCGSSGEDWLPEEEVESTESDIGTNGRTVKRKKSVKRVISTSDSRSSSHNSDESLSSFAKVEKLRHRKKRVKALQYVIRENSDSDISDQVASSKSLKPPSPCYTSPLMKTPRRSARQSVLMRRRANFSLPDRLERLESVTPKGENGERPGRNKTSSCRKARPRKPVNDFLKEWSSYNAEKCTNSNSSLSSDELDDFIVDQDSDREVTFRVKFKHKRTKDIIEKVSSTGSSESCDEVQNSRKKKIMKLLSSEDEDMHLTGDEITFQSSSDDIEKEVRELETSKEEFSIFEEKRLRRNSRKECESLGLLRKQRELRKLPKKDRDLVVSPEEERCKLFENSPACSPCEENDNSLDDFIVSDSNDDDCTKVGSASKLFTGHPLGPCSNVHEDRYQSSIVDVAGKDIVSEIEAKLEDLFSENIKSLIETSDGCPVQHRKYLLDFDKIQLTGKLGFSVCSSDTVDSSPTIDKQGRTLLHIAVICGDSKSLQYFLQNIPQLNMSDKHLMLPLLYAALHKHVFCYEMLLNQSNLSFCHSHAHKHFGGKNLLHFIIFIGKKSPQSEVFALQKKCLEITRRYSIKFYRKLLKKQDQQGFTPVMYAITTGNPEVLKFLVNEENLLNFGTEFHGSPLHFVIQHCDSCGCENHAACLEVILPRLLDKIDESDCNGFTPLMYAAELGSASFLKTLLDHGASVFCKDAEGTTALHLAALSGSTECVQLLLSSGHPVDCVDGKGWMPLLYANFQAHETCVAALMEADPKQIFVLSELLQKGDTFQKTKNRKVVESVIMCLAHFDTYYTIFNDFVRYHPDVVDANNSGLFTNLWRSILDFDNKLRFFRRRIADRVPHKPTFRRPVEIDRQNVLGSFFLALNFYSPLSLRRIDVTFRNEPATCDGPKREFLSLFCREVASEERRIFHANAQQQYSPVGNAYFHRHMDAAETAKTSKSNWRSLARAKETSRRLAELEMIGRLLASFIADGHPLDIAFAKPFLKQVLRLPLVHPEDLEFLDPELYRSSIEYVMNNDVAELDIDFLYTTVNPWNGHLTEVPLRGQDDGLCMTNENKAKYCEMLSKFKTEVSTEKETRAFCNGFYQEIPLDVLRLFTSDDFSLLINGIQTIDVDDLRENTQTSDCHNGQREVEWFWRTVKALKEEEKALLLKFWTGTSCVPIGGFKNMRALGGARGLTVAINWNIQDKIPTAYTCFNRLELSRYQSEKELREKLLIAVRHGSEGFSFG